MANLNQLKLGSRVAYLVTKDGHQVSLGFTPETAQVGGIGWSWTDVPRQGQQALSYLNAKATKTLSFTTRMVTPHNNIAGDLRAFETLANFGVIVRTVNLSSVEGGWWRVTNLAYSIDKRGPDQQPQQATINWSLTQAVLDDSPKIGRTKVTPVKSTAARNYTVKAGDTLYSIAQSQLGDGTRWPEIANLNHLRAFSVFSTTIGVTPGQVLKIPTR